MLKKCWPLVALLALAGCNQSASSPIADVRMDNGQTGDALPILGQAERRAVPGHDSVTVYAKVPPFRLHDQDGKLVTNQLLAGKVYVTDFFFATCPGICPKMQSEMLKVYQAFGQNPDVVILSHTIDPDHDTPAVLREYASRLGVAQPGSHWRFVRTSRDSTYALAGRYLTGAEPDSAAPGGIAHSGTLALVDDRGYVRGAYDGLNAEQTAQLLSDLPRLLAEVKTRHATAATR